MTEYNTGKPAPEDFDIVSFKCAKAEVVQKMAEALGLVKIPQLYLLDKDGMIIFKSEDEDMGKVFEAVHESKNPIPTGDRLAGILE